jgi:hypothetical protein
MEYIYIVIRKIGELESVMSAHKSHNTASIESKKLLKRTLEEGYTDFTYHIKTVQLS